MRHGFPYKTQPCTHCRPEDLYCDWCLGSHREIRSVNNDCENGYFPMLFVLIVLLTVLAMIGASR